MKTSDLFIRPIRHWNPERVKGHVFVCMLAYLIVWKARAMFAEFISSNQVCEEDTPEEQCHSLRTLWEKLNGWMTIGKLRIGGQIQERLSALPAEAKALLAAANADPTPAAVARLRLVG